MKLTATVFTVLLSALSSLANADSAPAGRYTVFFKTTVASCTGKESTDLKMIEFGERDKTGRCLDNSQLSCTRRLTLSLGRGFSVESQAVMDGPRICTS